MANEKITEEEVESISSFARISLDDDEIEDLVPQLNEILDYFDKIDEADTEGVEPLFGVHGKKNVFRDDDVGESMSQETALQNAEKTEDGYFKSPRVRD
ncbi:Asp-tRNAAsn/Glu-tRNAGln amidotransferase C subunit, GatC [Methanonatronarchaeum thermophilum]|uniref:Aspartyl/glutamyl-tRNA(Asn/Gln) amidotransferase subunit C n=1 Tax=Methanonatronarchaeum thermophilum TaxID=1927129 RepID=A0A1Y3GB06_9EURY|nr:Asp-tRNA(Asn)/Glu-tRNA(Gln) amidotransferase subunit GatC [Methanonatronarchaeum thermophilum]OUJ18589.1 Asp-tRNAAsn/Glu-tRNAGln amidotransferase C subunit, GatC [Methanonatronarchaeum thermophilum]